MPHPSILLGIMAGGALVAGVIGWGLASRGAVLLVGPIARELPADRHAPFLADPWTHSASYRVGPAGGIVVMLRVWRWRGRAAAAQDAEPGAAAEGSEAGRGRAESFDGREGMASRDDQFWAEYLGVDPSEWASKGVSVRAHAGLVGYRGLWCFRRLDRVVVSVPAGWAASLAASLAHCEPDTLFDEAFLVKWLGTEFEQLIGPAFQGCLQDGRFRPAHSIHVRFLGPNDTAAVERFRAECGTSDWESGSLDKVRHHMAAYFDRQRIAAMGGYRPWNDRAGDPCVVTHPECRRRGYGSAVVSQVVRAALEEGKLLLYQTLEANRGAVQIALNLGYEQYARHVAVRLKREAPSNTPLQPAAEKRGG